MPETEVVTISTYEGAREAYRSKHLRQALYDAGEVIMSDVIVNLHGDDHRARRRLENRLYRRDTFAHYERDLFPDIIDTTLRPHLEAGRAELVGLGHQLMMNLAALTAGIDRPHGTPDETFRLHAFLKTFIEGATLAHYTGDKDVKRAEVQDALDAFDAEFLRPSIDRRLALIAQHDAGDLDEADLPRDVLCVLLRNVDALHLPHDAIRREIAFYLLAGAHTSATAFTRVTHQILEWLDAHPDDAERVRTDRLFVQRCTHETVRLQPSSPVAMRWALADVDLGDGVHVSEGDKVVIDLVAVNRDPSVFGDDAEAFDPFRTLPSGVAPYGLSFGLGMHACIGQDMAAGLLTRDDGALDEHLFGLVPQAVQWLFDHGCRRDPDDAPEMDESTTRPYFGRYPVLLGD